MTKLTVAGADGSAKELAIHATASTAHVYQRIFKRGFYADIESIRTAGEDVTAVQDIFPMVFYVWHLLERCGNGLTITDILKKTEADYIEWLMDYSMTAFVSPEAVQAFADEYARGLDSHSTPKN